MSAPNETLNQLIIDARTHPPDSTERQRLTQQIYHLILNRLWKDDSPHYNTALQETWEYFCQHLDEYDPTRGSVITWLNSRLRRTLQEWCDRSQNSPTILDLAWNALDHDTQQVALLLSLFAPTPIPQAMLKQVADAALDNDANQDAIATACNALIQRFLLQPIDATTYQLHTPIRAYLQTQLNQSTQSDRYKQAFTQAMATFAKRLSDSPPIAECDAFAPAIPHITEAATTWQTWLEDDSIVFPFFCLGRFYTAQGALDQATHWYEQGLLVARNRLGSEHLAIAACLTHLANLYYTQSRYQDAEPLYQEAVQLLQQLLGKDHPAVAKSLTNLAYLHNAQSRYGEAELLYIDAFFLLSNLFGNAHVSVAESLDNLANFYQSQERHQAAIILFQKSLKLRQQILGQDHPNVVISLNKLASFYPSQRSDRNVETFFQDPNIQALPKANQGDTVTNSGVMAVLLQQSWRSRLQADFADQPEDDQEAIIQWLLGEDAERFDRLDPAQLALAQQAMDYRYRILQKRYLGIHPELAYQKLIQRLSSLFLIRRRIHTWVALSRDRQRGVVDVLQEVIQELIQSDSYINQQSIWIAQCTVNYRLRNALVLSTVEEYCLRPIRNEPLLLYRCVSYLRRAQQRGIIQDSSGDLVRLLSEEFDPVEENRSISSFDNQSVAKYQEEQKLKQQEFLRITVRDKFIAYIEKEVNPLAARWLELHLQGQSQEAIADTLGLSTKQVYRLREKISYHAVRVFAMQYSEGDLVKAWLSSSSNHTLESDIHQGEMIWEGLTDNQQQLLKDLEPRKTFELIIQELNVEPVEITGEWSELFNLSSSKK